MRQNQSWHLTIAIIFRHCKSFTNCQSRPKEFALEHPYQDHRLAP